MSADFWAGYISGAVGIIIGNPLDVLKVKLQAGVSSQPPVSSTALPLPSHSQHPTPVTTSRSGSGKLGAYIRPFLTGTAAPVLGYGALNALLFVSYNRTEEFLNSTFSHSPSSAAGSPTTGTNLYTTFLAGAIGGLATWVVSTPTELIKCRVQLASSSSSSSSTSSRSPNLGSSAEGISSWSATKAVLRTEGIKGLYFGGLVTALRDSIGYGFYFWSYELSSRWMAKYTATSAADGGTSSSNSNAASVLLCGGLAGIVTWASIFPLDVIKTRVQTQVLNAETTSMNGAQTPLLQTASTTIRKKKPLGAWEITKQTYAEGGIKPFFRGLGVCSVRAFIVNAVQWAVYEWIMAELGVGRNRVPAGGSGTTTITTTGEAFL
ncbi:Mitochondrial carrier domain containing protein [Naviculisporaceae sp. PSN 640]